MNIWVSAVIPSVLSGVVAIIVCLINNSRLTNRVKKDMLNYEYKQKAIDRINKSVSYFNNWLCDNYGGGMDYGDRMDIYKQTDPDLIDCEINDVLKVLNENSLYIEDNVAQKVRELIGKINSHIHDFHNESHKNHHDQTELGLLVNSQETNSLIESIISELKKDLDAFK